MGKQVSTLLLVLQQHTCNDRVVIAHLIDLLDSLVISTEITLGYHCLPIDKNLVLHHWIHTLRPVYIDVYLVFNGMYTVIMILVYASYTIYHISTLYIENLYESENTMRMKLRVSCLHAIFCNIWNAHNIPQNLKLSQRILNKYLVE